MSCSGGLVGVYVYIAKRIVNTIWLLGPILAIVSLFFNITLMLKDPENEKLPKKIKNSVIALVLLFFIPTLVNVAMSLTDNNISACWKSANSGIKYNSKYVNLYSDDDPKNIFFDANDYERGQGAAVEVQGNCQQLTYCSMFIKSMVENSEALNEAILNNHGSVYYSTNTKRSWADAIQVAKSGGTVRISCNRPSQWGVKDATGEYRDFYSEGTGGFKNYKGEITKYTKEIKYDSSMSVKTAIQKGLVQPGDIIGAIGHTFTIYSVNQKDGSAVVFDGGHRYTSKCQEKKKCSTMFTYTPDTTSGIRLCQIIRWIK